MIESKLRSLLSALRIDVERKTPDGWLVASCPFAEDSHKGGVDRNPSFMVHVNESGLSGYNCWSCKAHGPLTRLVRRLEYLRGADYQELYMQAILDETPDTFGDFERTIDEEEEMPNPVSAAQFVGMFLPAWESRESRRYLLARDISERTAVKLGLLYDEDEARILFPVYGSSKAEFYGFTGRTILPENRWPAQREGRAPYSKIKNYAGLKKKFRLLGEHFIQKPRPLFVVEGLFGWAHLFEIGADSLCNPVALMGSSLSAYQRNIIIGYDLPTYLCADDDLAGDILLFGQVDSRTKDHDGNGAVAALEQNVPTHIVQYPPGVNDIDLLTKRHVRDILTS